MADNTIQALRKVQFGAEAVKAQGTLTMDTQPTAADTVTVGAVTYIWVNSGATAGHINKGADLAAAKLAFVAAINGTDAINDPNPYASAAAFIGNVCTLTARIPGPFGNTIVTTETFTAVTNIFNGVTLGTTTSGAHARGTVVAATSILAIEDITWSDDPEKIYRPKIANGLLLRNRGRATATHHGTDFSWTDQPMVWEQLMHKLSMAVGSPVLTGPAGGPYVWTFGGTPTSNPNPMSFTLERLFSNGLGDTVEQRAAYCMLKQYTLKFAVGEHLREGATGFARFFETNSITGGLTMPDPELGVSALSQVYVDDEWGDLGSTLLAEQVIGWEFTIGTGIFPRDTAEGRTTKDFTKHQLNGNERLLDFKLTIELDPTTYNAEAAHADAGDQRAVRLKIIGSDGREVDFDMLMQYSKPTLFKFGEDQGQDTVLLEMEEATDNTHFLTVTETHPSVYSLA